jgi:hypothetical protein
MFFREKKKKKFLTKMLLHKKTLLSSKQNLQFVRFTNKQKSGNNKIFNVTLRACHINDNDTDIHRYVNNALQKK